MYDAHLGPFGNALGAWGQWVVVLPSMKWAIFLLRSFSVAHLRGV